MRRSGRSAAIITRFEHLFIVIERALEHVDLLELCMGMERREGASIALHQQGLLAALHVLVERLDPEPSDLRWLPLGARALEVARAGHGRRDRAAGFHSLSLSTLAHRTVPSRCGAVLRSAATRSSTSASLVRQPIGKRRCRQGYAKARRLR